MRFRSVPIRRSTTDALPTSAGCRSLPKQVTNLSWDNAALMSIGDDGRPEGRRDRAIEIELNGRKVMAPVLMAPGHPDGVITVHLGLAAASRRAAWARASASTPTCCALRTLRWSRLARRRRRLTGTIYDLCVTKVHSTEHRGSVRAAGPEQSGVRHAREPTRWPATRRWSASIIRYATVEEAKKNPKFAERRRERHAGEQGRLRSAGREPGAGDPAGSRRRSQLSIFPDAWNYKQDRSVDAEACRTRGAWRSI